MIAHVTPSASDARPNLLKLSERTLPKQVMRASTRPSGPIKNALKCVSNKNPGANQAHQCCNCLDHRKHPLRAPRKPNDVAPRTVKRISKAQIGIELDRGFRATGCAK